MTLAKIVAIEYLSTELNVGLTLHDKGKVVGSGNVRVSRKNFPTNGKKNLNDYIGKKLKCRDDTIVFPLEGVLISRIYNTDGTISGKDTVYSNTPEQRTSEPVLEQKITLKPVFWDKNAKPSEEDNTYESFPYCIEGYRRGRLLFEFQSSKGIKELVKQIYGSDKWKDEYIDEISEILERAMSNQLLSNKVIDLYRDTVSSKYFAIHNQVLFIPDKDLVSELEKLYLDSPDSYSHDDTAMAEIQDRQNNPSYDVLRSVDYITDPILDDAEDQGMGEWIGHSDNSRILNGAGIPPSIEYKIDGKVIKVEQTMISNFMTLNNYNDYNKDRVYDKIRATLFETHRSEQDNV